MGEEQTVTIGPVLSGSQMFIKTKSKILQQTTKADGFCCDGRFKGYDDIYQE